LQILELPLAGLKLIRPRVFRDARGHLFETYQEPRYRAAGIDCSFVQDNFSRSFARTLRGLHYQVEPGQAKLLRVTLGQSYHVAVDIRPGSPSFGRWHGVKLDADEASELFLPVGFAHGFCALSEVADVAYKVSALYDPATERAIRWDDPTLGIVWPVENPVLSERDRLAESFAEFARRIGAA
jgi:dTDP-4-dehydrorhamnose 3,5-epimerase